MTDASRTSVLQKAACLDDPFYLTALLTSMVQEEKKKGKGKSSRKKSRQSDSDVGEPEDRGLNQQVSDVRAIFPGGL